MTKRETVHAVYDYYDGPRAGVADFDGSLHYFECVFDEATDDWSEEFLLTPLPQRIFPLIAEDWSIWLRWYSANQAGRTTRETHPALPEDRPEHERLSRELQPYLRTDPALAFKAHAHFEGGRRPEISAVFVTWSRVD